MSNRSYTLSELAKITGSTVVGDAHYLIQGISDLEHATQEDISFLSNSRYLQAMEKSKAGAIFIDHQTPLPTNRNFLLTDNPSLSFQKTLELFYGNKTDISGFKAIHATAVIHPSAQLGRNVQIGPYVVIDQDVCIGDDTVILAHCSIGLGTKIGKNCLLHPHVVIREHCQVGDRVILQPGCVIGACGFGYTQNRQGEHCKIPQLGNVVIESDVEVGANTTIDRARFKSTKVKQGTKIDNLVQIAHNDIIGRHNIIVAQTGIAGSTETGDYVLIGGQAAIDGHLKIGDKTQIAARSGVTKSLSSGIYGGAPAVPMKDFTRNVVQLRNIEKYIEEIQELKKRIEKLE